MQGDCPDTRKRGGNDPEALCKQNLGFHFLGDLVAAHYKHAATSQQLLRHIPSRLALLGDRLTQKS